MTALSDVAVGALRRCDYVPPHTSGVHSFSRSDGADTRSAAGRAGMALRTAHQIRGFAPERREEIPSAALREAVVNALVHRDYTIPGPTRVFVLNPRVEVRSPGRPPNSVDAEAMRAGVHVTRNPHIYSRVADLQLATRAGSGIRRIARLLREHSGADLGITISDAEVMLTLPRARPDLVSQ